MGVEPGEALPQRFGKYTLLRKLATGGMAELFLALHRSVAGFEKLVVIKRILPAMNQDKAFIDMLLHEARIAATLSHPNIVQTFDVGMIDGTYYIAMEHIHGEDLRSIVRQMKKMGVVEFPLPHALAVIIGQCSGLAYAHEKRDLEGRPLEIVHRDISPQNVVVTFSGDVKIVDFGIAKSGAKIGEDTKSGQLKGKVPYMSPEQAAGEEIDWRSDIFATGVMLFELTTGRRLFKGASEYETLKLICEKEYPLPSQVRPGFSPRLERIVMKALAKKREERYQTAREMQADLEAFVRDERIPVSQIALGEWMGRLFKEKIAQQKEALQDIKQLADVIAAHVDDENRLTGEFGPQSSIMPSAPAASRTVTTAGQAKGKRGGVWIGALAVVALGGAGAFFYVHSKQQAPVPVAATAAPSATAPEPDKNHGVLAITSDPPGAAIWIDGDLRRETTPARLEKLPVGATLHLRLTKDGFEPVKQEVVIGDAENKLEATLRKGSVTLVVKANVPSFAIWVDGKSVPGPKVEGLSAGEEHKVVVGAAGYAAKTSTFSAGQGETKTIELTLDKARPGDTSGSSGASAPSTERPAAAGGSGKLNVAARGGYCNVSVDGAGHGPTPVGGIVLSAGTHRVSCKPESGASMSQTVKIEDGQTARISFTIPQ